MLFTFLSGWPPRTTTFGAKALHATGGDATDDEALEAFQLCAKLEGILPALEPSHAFAYVMRAAPSLPKDHLLVMNLCGRGDKDIFTVAERLGVSLT